MDVDWESLFGIHKSPLEVLLRGTIVYAGLLILLTLTRNREGGSVGSSNLLVLILMGGASHHALTGESYSVTEGMMLVGVIAFWSWLVDTLSYRIPAVAEVLRPGPKPLVRNGALVPENLERESITEEELMAALRLHGVERVEDVKLAVIEGHGEISVIRYDTERTGKLRRRLA